MRKKIIFFLKITISLMIIVYLFSRISLQQVYNSWQIHSLGTILVLILLLMVNLIIQLWRWKIVTTNHISQVRFEDIVKSFFAGFALRLSMPGGHAEIGKILMVNWSRKEALLAFGAEKYIIASTHFLGLGLAGWHIFPQFQGGFLAVIALAVALFAIYPYLKRLPFLKRHLNPEISYSSSMIMVAVLTIVMYALVTTQYYLMLLPAKTLNWFEIASIVIILIGSTMIPISYSGLGIREGVGIFLFGLFGVEQEMVVSMTLLIFFMNAVTPALIGLGVIINHKRE